MTLVVSPAGRRYGYKKDKPDHRDLGLARLARVTSHPLSVDLEEFCGPVKDQQDLGACTAFAACGMREFLYRRYAKFEKTVLDAPVFSPLFLYYKEREMEGSVVDDAGSCGRTSVKVLNTVGVCLESADPYAPHDFRRPPTDQQLTDALEHRAGAYHRIFGVDDMKSCLASEYVFVIGFMVYQSFERPGWTMMPTPTKGDEILGGHEVLVIGYDDTKGAFKVRNSWGSAWGQSGNFWFPYELAANQEILMDAWMCHLGKPW